MSCYQQILDPADAGEPLISLLSCSGLTEFARVGSQARVVAPFQSKGLKRYVEAKTEVFTMRFPRGGLFGPVMVYVQRPDLQSEGLPQGGEHRE